MGYRVLGRGATISVLVPPPRAPTAPMSSIASRCPRDSSVSASGRSKCSTNSCPPRFQSPTGATALPARPRLIKIPMTFGAQAMENTPVVFNSRPLLVLNHRDDTKSKTDAYKRSMYLYIQDLTTGREVARFGEGHSFANAFVNGPELSVFASEGHGPRLVPGASTASRPLT